jgi:hypothetical protein
MLAHLASRGGTSRGGAAFGAAAAVAVAVFLVLASATTFRVDDWELIANRSLDDPASLLRPWNEQLILVPAIIFRAIFGFVGLHSYLPYLAVLLGLHVICAAAVRRLVAHLAGATAGLAAGLLVLFLGSGYENLDAAFQIGQVIATAAGVAALDAAVRHRPGVAAGLLLIALASHAVGGAFLIGVAVILILSDPRALRWLLAPVVPCGIWFVLIDLPTFGSRQETAAEAIRALPAFMVAGPFAAAGAVVGLGLVGGLIVVASGLGFAGLARIPVSDRVAVGGALATILAEYGLIALSRASFGIEATSSSRYVYSSAPLVLILAAAWVGSSPRRLPGTSRARATGVLALGTAVAIVGNLNVYRVWLGTSEEFSERVRAASAIVAWSPGAGPLRSDPVLPGPDRLRAILATSGSPVRDTWVPFVARPVSEGNARQACQEMIGRTDDEASCLAAVAAAIGRH